MDKPNCISITGGTGHLGTCLIQLLLANGFQVKALYNRSNPQINHNNLIWIKGDVTDTDCMKNLIQDSHILVHSAAIISIGDKNETLVFNTNVNGTKTAIDVCSKHHTKLVYISSSNAVKETSGSELFDEKLPYKTEHDFLYGYTKALSEQLVLKDVQENKLKGYVIRPTSIIGPPDYVPSHFGQTILDMHFGKIPAITTSGYNLVDVRDLSQTIINSFAQSKNGEVYLVGGNYFSLKEVAYMANSNKKPLVLPLNLLLLFAPLISLFGKLFKIKWPVTKESLLILKHAPKQVDSSKAIRQLNHSIRPTQESIKDLITWYNKRNINES